MEREDHQIEKTFWGCTITKEDCSPEIEVKKSLHISMANLSIKGNELPRCLLRVYLYMQLNRTRHMICSLDTDKNWQVPLDLNIEKETQVSFFSVFNRQLECRTRDELNCYIHQGLDSLYNKLEPTVYLTGYQHSEEELPEKIAERMTALSLSFVQNTLEREREARESMEIIETSDRSENMTALDSEGITDEQAEKEKFEAPNRQQISEENERQEEMLTTEENVTEIKTKERQQNISGAEQQGQVHDSSLHVQEILKSGGGPSVTPGNSVIVNYVGRLESKKHTYTVIENDFKFCLGRDEVIRVLDEGIIGMNLGEKRRITCPPSMAHGIKGIPPIIPRNSTFVFDIELVAIVAVDHSESAPRQILGESPSN